MVSFNGGQCWGAPSSNYCFLKLLLMSNRNIMKCISNVLISLEIPSSLRILSQPKTGGNEFEKCMEVDLYWQVKKQS